jgi:hypothetical protein
MRTAASTVEIGYQLMTESGASSSAGRDARPTGGGPYNRRIGWGRAGPLSWVLAGAEVAGWNT